MSDTKINALIDPETCGSCGVYRSLHPIKTCVVPTTSWWWKRHYLHEHVLNWLWIHVLPSKARWWIADKLEGPNHHWCHLVDSCTRADDKDWLRDYREPNGCLCEFPSFWKRIPRPTEGCYCTPPPEVAW